METLDMNITNDSTTIGSSAGGLIAFDVIFWIFISIELTELWYLIQFQRSEGYVWAHEFPLVTGCGASSKTAYARVVTGVIVIGMTVALLTLVVGGVLSAQNGTSSDSTDTPQLSAEGFSGHVLLILSAVIQLLVWTVAFVVVAHGILGCTRTCVCASVLGCMFGTMFVLDVAFLSWSSFKLDTVQVTNGSISTATPGPTVVELIAFAALSWGATLSTPIITWFFAYFGITDQDRKKASKFSVMTAIAIGIPPLLLVAGSVLSLLNGGSTDTPGMSAEGITGRVLLILTEVISMLFWLIMFAPAAYFLLDKCESASAIALECVFTTLSMIGVALLGWSSFEFDPVQINGTNSTVTPGLRTAGVVISSVCIGIPFIVSTVLGCVFLCGTSDCTKNIIDRLVKAVKKRIKKTKETEEARLRRSKSLLEEALKHGFVTCRTVVCLLVGVAGAGKTHTQHLLLKKNPPKSRTSTPIAVKPVRAVLVSAKSGELQEVSIDHLDKILAATVATGVSLKDITSWCRCFGNDSQTTSKGISQPPPSSGQEVDLEEKPVATSHNNSFWYCCLAPLDSDSQRLLETTKAALDKTAHQIATTSGPQQLLNGDWIYLIDSGGQIEFLEVLPAFLRHTSVCLFVANLSEELSNRPKIEYYEDGKPVGEPTLCPFTNEQMLMRCVQTIQTQCNIQEGSTNQGQGSKLAMIGTHRDCEDQCSEKREEKNQKLHSKLSPIFGQNLIFYGQKMKELIFPVNAKTPDAEDHEVAKELTKEILKVASSLEPRKTPISWFEFEKHIHMLGRKLLHWKECLRLARMLHLSKRNLDAALDHLASFGVIHYYPHLLPDVVFVDPQFLLDKISELVKFHYKLRCNPDPHTATQGELQKFRNEGCITLKLLKQFPEQYTDFFTPADFLKLMNDRLITAHLINEDEYFMPCLLRTIELEEVDQYRVTTSGVAPLAIHFPCQLVPHGVFCSLVAFLQSSQNSSPWRLSLCPTDHSEPLCLTRNCIKFQLPESAPGSLTLIDTFSHFEVYVDAPYDVCANLCLSIQHTLFRGIQKAAKTLGYHQLDPKLAFLCTECKNIQPHLALPADALDYWKCEHKPATVYGKLTDEHLVWCPEEGVHMEAQPRPVSQKHQRHKEEVQLPLKTLSEMSEGVLMEEAQPIALSKKHKRVEAPNEVHIPLETYSEAQRGMQAPPTEVHVVLEVPSEIKEATTDCPTLVECIRFRGLERMINIAEKISTKYHDFGLLLLDDHNGTRVRNMELKHREDPERINKEILQEWATGRGKQPVSWKTLIEVLRDIELDTLASEIEAVKEL